jgi:hypothetical protein
MGRPRPRREFSNDVLVEGVADVGTVQRHVFDRAAAIDGQELIAHLLWIIPLDRILQNLEWRTT